MLAASIDIEGVADGSMGLFAHPQMPDLARTLSGTRGVPEGRGLAKVFAGLRPDEPVFNGRANDHPMGHEPAACFGVCGIPIDPVRAPPDTSFHLQ